MFLSSLLLKQGRNCAIVYLREEEDLPTELFRVDGACRQNKALVRPSPHNLGKDVA